MRNVALALRSLCRAPAVSLAVVASLGISIGAVTTVFSVADAVLFRALPWHEPGRLVWVASVRSQRSDAPFSLPEYMDYSARARTVDLAAFGTWSAAMATSGVARRLVGMKLSANAFDVLGAVPSAGRLFRPADDRPDAPLVVVLSYPFWRDHFAGSPAAIGDRILLDDRSYEIVGVLPRHFPLPLPDLDVVVPLSPDRDPRRHVRGSVNFLRFFGRARGGSSLAAVQQDMSAVAASLRGEFPVDYAAKLGAAVTPMQDALVGNTRPTFVVMLGAAAVLLAVALANVLNLLLTRGVARRGEVAVRRALGGSSRHLAIGATSEALLLALAGTLLGGLLARWLVSLVSTSGIGVLRLDEVRIGGRTLLVTIAISLAATVLFSLIQLAAAARTPPRQALAGMGRGLHGSPGEARLRRGFLVVQLALAVLLTSVTATMAGSLARLQRVELGYRPDSVVVGRLALPPGRYRSAADLARFAEQFEQALGRFPGVQAAGGISVAPLSPALSIIPFDVVGRAPDGEGDRPEAHFRAITPGYLPAVGATLRAGRAFTPADDGAATRVALINHALAVRYFGGSDPLGRQLLLDDNNTGPRPVTIVGVVNDMRHTTLDGAAPFDIYIPMAQVHPDGAGFLAGSQFWVARIRGADPAQLITGVLGGIDRDVAIAAVRPLRAYVDAYLAPRRFSVLALLGFAIVSLALATIGVYGVVAYSVEQRRREIGLRLAIGASGRDITRTFVRPILRLSLLGAGIGVAGALLTRRFVAGLLFGVTPTEPAVLGLASLLLVATSALAAGIPARRAANVDPMVALVG